MGTAWEVVNGRVTNPGAAFTPVTFATGDAGAVKAFNVADQAFLENAWYMGATAGTARIRSPKLHDNQNGIRFKGQASDPRPKLPLDMYQPIFPLDVLIIESTGGAAEVDVVTIVNYYQNMPNASVGFVMPDALKGRIQSIVTVETQHVTGATAGDYGGSVAFNSFEDLLQGGAVYALLGFLVDTSVACVGWRGPDTGNYRIGGPGIASAIETRRWFADLSERTGRPHIPLIQQANARNTSVDLVSNGTAQNVVVQSILAELSS